MLSPLDVSLDRAYNCNLILRNNNLLSASTKLELFPPASRGLERSTVHIAQQAPVNSFMPWERQNFKRHKDTNDIG